MHGLARMNPLPPELVLLTSRRYCQGRGPLQVPLDCFLTAACKVHLFQGRASGLLSVPTGYELVSQIFSPKGVSSWPEDDPWAS